MCCNRTHPVCYDSARVRRNQSALVTAVDSIVYAWTLPEQLSNMSYLRLSSRLEDEEIALHMTTRSEPGGADWGDL